jgi:putative RNA 2'-phosphotransferase
LLEKHFRMTDDINSKRISKFLSYVLRHKPDAIGLQLDEHGWASVDTLIEGCRKSGLPLTSELLQYIVTTNSKKRFSFNDSFDKIRANQGHSVKVDLAYTAIQPPDVLYHGTSVVFVDSISVTGLHKRNDIMFT